MDWLLKLQHHVTFQARSVIDFGLFDKKLNQTDGISKLHRTDSCYLSYCWDGCPELCPDKQIMSMVKNQDLHYLSLNN